MVLGALSLSLAAAPAGAERRRVGWVIVGRSGSGTALTLYVVPTAYTLLASRERSGDLRAGPAPLPGHAD
jgi:multidrug efflux pump